MTNNNLVTAFALSFSTKSPTMTYLNSSFHGSCTKHDINLTRLSIMPSTQYRCQKSTPLVMNLEGGSSQAGDGELEKMRSRLEGLLNIRKGEHNGNKTTTFNGMALRRLIKDKWTVQYDVRPVLRMGRVYLQVMWRYFEQQSFYLKEDEFGMHMEAVAQMIVAWNAVDHVRNFIKKSKKKPVVGATVSIPIPNVDSAQYEEMLSKL